MNMQQSCFIKSLKGLHFMFSSWSDVCVCSLQDELLAELERLENSLDENLFEEDGAEDRDLSSPVLPTASPSRNL